ncbi:MAG: helix-turn-helix domain-containing protein [Candidatus Flemingiibacterium sp.]
MEFIEKLYHTDIDGSIIGDLKLCYCGKRTGAVDHSFGPAARDNYWLIFLREGRGSYTVGSKTFRISPGDLFVAFPNRRIFYKADPGSVWSICWFSIDSEKFGEYLALAGINEEQPIVRISSPAELTGICDSLLEEIPRETLRSKFTCSALVYRLLTLLAPSEETPKKRDYIDEAIFFMSNNYISPISGRELAERLNLEPSYFARIFRQRTGVSPMKWLSELRLSRAAQLLLSTDLMISEIALSVGFTDPLYFTRRFSLKYKVSPSEYRSAHQLPQISADLAGKAR